MEAPKQATPEVEETPVQETIADSPQALLQQLGGPNQEQIDAWKVQHGNVFVSGFSQNEMYVWRPLLRSEYRDLQLAMADDNIGMDQLQYEELLCATCVLWPTVDPEYFAKGKGGTASTLSEQIMQGSNFMNPAQLVQFVAPL